jgi:hypothetical protein
LGEAGPFAEGEVDEIVNARNVVGDEVDSPEAARNDISVWCFGCLGQVRVLPSIAIAC